MATASQVRATDNAHSQAPASLKKQMLIVLGATVLMPTCTFLGTRLYSLHFKVEEVSALLIFRIASSVLLAIGTLGMPIALQRSIAFHYQSARFKADLAMAGSVLATIGLAIVAATCILFAPSIAARMGHPEAAGLWSAMSVVTVGCGLVTTLTCIDLSRGRTRVSAITNAFGYGIAFLLPVAIIRGTSITTLAWITAACTFATCVPAGVNVAKWWLETRRLKVEPEKPHAFRSLLGYGVPRIFANLLDPAFDLLLPWAALYVSGLSSAGYFAAGLALLRPLNPVMSAINMILIPASARLAAEEARDRQKARTTIVAQAAFHLGLLAAILLATWGDAVMRLWLGDPFAEAGRYIRVLALSVCPLLLYQCARGIIDGENERAYNTRNLVLAFVVFVVGVVVCNAFGLGLIGLAFAYLSARAILGAMSISHLMRAHSLSLRDLAVLPGLAASLGALLISIGFRWTMGSSIGIAALGIAASGMFFLVYARWSRVRWVQAVGWSR